MFIIISRLNVNMYNIYIDKSIYQIIYFQHICIFADELKITHMDLCIDSLSYKKKWIFTITKNYNRWAGFVFSIVKIFEPLMVSLTWIKYLRDTQKFTIVSEARRVLEPSNYGNFMVRQRKILNVSPWNVYTELSLFLGYTPKSPLDWILIIEYLGK